MPPIRQQALGLFRQLADTLIVYDLSRIDQDLLKQLYQNLVDPKTRHDLGEYYTPDWLAELAALSLSAHAEIVFMRESKPKGGVAALRKLARRLTEKQLSTIDKLAQSVLNLAAP